MIIEFEKESGVEKFADATMVTATTLGALGGALLGGLAGAVGGALLSVLASIPASKRHKSRTENTLIQVVQTLNQHEEELANLSDAQFKMINETLLTILHNLEEEKLNYLKSVIRNTLDCQDLTHHEAALLSRIIRDMSAAEAKFLVNSADGREPFEEIIIYEVPAECVKEKALWLSPQSENTVLATGLINLGLLLPEGSGLGGSLSYRFSPVAKTLMKLLKSDSSSNLEERGQAVALQVPDHPFFGMRANDSRSVTEIMRQLRGESAHDV